MSQYGPPQNLPRTFRCGNHPEREGVGICVSCRAVICVECSTKVDRMNYCIQCLTAASAPLKEKQADNPGREAVLGIPLLVAAFVAAVGVFWALGYAIALFRSTSPGGVTVG